MAQQVITHLIDDIDGSEASETVTFALDGKTYEIDLTDKNAGKLRKLLTPYVSNGRRLRGVKGPGRTAKARNDTGAIREWATENGYEVNSRGRIPAEIREAYQQANN